MLRLPKLLPAVIVAAGIVAPMTLTAQTPPALKLEKVPGGYTFSIVSRNGYIYYAEHSINGENWVQLPSMKLGDGNAKSWSFSAPEPGIPRNLYRVRESLTGGYTATTAAALDSDSDGLTDMDELGNIMTNPFNKDTDGDGIDDLSEHLAGLNPNVPDDSSPGEFIIQWQRTDSAYLAPRGWQSLATSITPAKPNYYRSITAEAIEKKSSATSGSEFNTGKTMTIQRVLQTQTPLRYAPEAGGFFPVYQEQATYSFTVGQPFVAITSHLDPASWGTPSPGAFAKRAKWPGQSIYDYGWTYAAPVSNQTVQGDFRNVIVPTEVTGDGHTWVNPAVAQGGNRYKKQSIAIGLPNRNFPSNGNVLPNSSWTAADAATSDETTEGIKTKWTLGNRWKYADVRSELERLRSSLHSVYEAQNENVSPTGLAIRSQSAEGDAQVDTYEFRFQKVGGGVGPTTLIWPETFYPLDNPETTANEGASPSVTRLRSVTLPPNTDQSIVFKVDPRVSNYTILPGETAPTGAVPFGYTEIGQLIEPEFTLVENWKTTFNPPQFKYFYQFPPNDSILDQVCVGSARNVPRQGVPEQMDISAKVKIRFPIDSPDANLIAEKYDLVLYQNITSNGPMESRYQTGAVSVVVSPIPCLDANSPLSGEPPDDSNMPRVKSFTSNNSVVEIRMVDSPGQRITLDPDAPSFPGTSGNLVSATQNTTFRTWLFAQERATGRRYYLKWCDWKMEANVKFNTPSLTDDQIIKLSSTKTDEGDGMGSKEPVKSPRIVKYVAIP